MDHHSGTTTCRRANLWYIPIICTWLTKSTSMQQINITYLNSEKHIYKHQLSITQKSHTVVYLFKAYQNINYIPKRMANKICVTDNISHIQNIYKKWPSKSDTATTPAWCLSRSIPSSLPQGRRRRLRFLQPKHQHLYGCGVSHIRTGESMSSPPQQYKTH
jgi:hypothetical protein